VPNVNFIIGSERSGTTIFGLCLNNHSYICVPPELQIITKFYDIFEFEQYERLTVESCNDIFNNINLPYNYEFNLGLFDFFNNYKFPPENLKKILDDIFQQILKTNNKKILFKQVPWYGQYIEIINKLYLNAKYIHIIRDGRDVALSFLKTKWYGDSLVETLNKWSNDVLKILEDSERFLEKDQITIISYEDLILNTQETLKKVCKFIGVSFEENMLNVNNIPEMTNKGWSNIISSDSYNEWLEKKNQMFFSDSVYRWKKDPSLFENIPDNVKKTLKRFGYET